MDEEKSARERHDVVSRSRTIFAVATALISIATVVVTTISWYAEQNAERDLERARTEPVAQIPDEDLEVLDIGGDDRPEFVRIDGEVFSAPEARTWVDRWGATVAGGIIAGLFAVAAAMLQRGSGGKDLGDRLERIERLLAGDQRQGALDGERTPIARR